ncbi:AcrR family transcriptional regulator [Paenibacillus phyllosphaerae]|uniref:AcrR family transcriptional regulator n=1 Tax=Paenibacillus phyllosphaerae TaxID=274593 RepID=A0A7W5ATH0_9BACL|nr:TetR/AcrR family transcriptional regulator [Paenibacillus phyllosphaerae]MBB3108468.1 AcrR family transcriptional regulator [Paenibacillus phyllosphaerae]
MTAITLRKGALKFMPEAADRRKRMTEEMKKSVRQAAERLFITRGYEAVTMREIAKEAGCSHTAIYLYFKNKEDLLQQIAIPSLLELEHSMLRKLEEGSGDRAAALVELLKAHVVFCLTHGSLHTVLFNAGSVRVDEDAPELEINQIRKRLFDHIGKALHLALSAHQQLPETGEEAVNRARILFYYVQGYVATYTNHREPVDQLLSRTLPYFELGIRTMVSGMQTALHSDLPAD